MGKKAALGGILTAISIIFLYLAFYLPSMKLTMYFLAGVIPALFLVEAGAGQAWLLYLSTSLLSFLLLGNPVNVIPYVCIFGLYPLPKHYIEKVGNIYLEIMLKLAFFNAAVSVVYFVLTRLFSINIAVPIPMAWLIISLQFVFLLYDYVFTRVIFYYCDRIRILWRKDYR